MKSNDQITRRTLSVLLLVAMLLFLLVSCQTGDGTGEETKTGTAPVTDAPITLNGVRLDEYTVVYSWADTMGEKNIALEIQKAIKKNFGITLNVKADDKDTPERVIAVGDLTGAAITSSVKSVEKGDWCLTADANRVYLLSKTEYGFKRALDALLLAITAASESRAVSVSAAEKQNYSDTQMTTMTFNIRNWDTSGSHLQRIRYIILNSTPDVIGFQEVSNKSGYAWIDKLMGDSVIAATYGYVGESCQDSTGQWTPIFYRKDKFTLVETDTRWLYCTHGIKCTSTECMGEDTAGNFSNNLEYRRIFTYARLKRISDGKEMNFINTHLETSGTEYQGVKVQTKEIDYILNFARGLTEKGETVVMTGDFNCQLGEAACQKILKAGFQSAERMSKNKVGKELPQGAMYAAENKAMSRMIDHVFIFAPNCIFETYTYCDEKINIRGELDYPSDHIPRIATYIVE